MSPPDIWKRLEPQQFHCIGPRPNTGPGTRGTRDQRGDLGTWDLATGAGAQRRQTRDRAQPRCALETSGLEYEADPRQAELLITELELGDAKCFITLGSKDDASRADAEKLVNESQ